MRNYFQLARAVAAIAVLTAAATGSGEAAPRPASPSIPDCVATWNAAPPSTGAARVAGRMAVIKAVAKDTFSVSWTKGSSLSVTGPACSVAIFLPSGHTLVITRPWSGAHRSHWEKPTVTTGLVSRKGVNAQVISGGMLKLR